MSFSVCWHLWCADVSAECLLQDVYCPAICKSIMGTHLKYIYLAWANKSVCITALAETFSILIAFLFAFPEKSPDCRVWDGIHNEAAQPRGCPCGTRRTTEHTGITQHTWNPIWQRWEFCLSSSWWKTRNFPIMHGQQMKWEDSNLSLSHHRNVPTTVFMYDFWILVWNFSFSIA